MPLTKHKKFHELIRIGQLFDSNSDRDESFPNSSDSVKYYIVSDDQVIGSVLLFSMDLRDGLIIVFVDDCGHTVTIDSPEKAEEYKSYYLAETTEEYQGVLIIMKEFNGDYMGPFYEIYKLRKLLSHSIKGANHEESHSSQCI